ncbi:protein-L-isoaspartate O-methyltransferase family protein [Pontivivens insulae]|uniref:Protein-L-isoaspartate O-methyltransferase n=1 Tax=Pontivivens insulae TaxID=1639689 RepID=A0A2R8AA50_9RHOB|nr:protein-L-isoaspartate O-methyltransferase [Pontivivens insulae]RED12990.1 protein-L-isoaspartate(D-aspartate) O-methyltransferase [Pontivivens insulae]SPF29083.1 Protein-L-isoaspartate O-methyltransferase [Pontivivens insulae]
MTDFAAARTAMVDCQIRPSDVTRFPIIKAMLSIPREEYLPSSARDVAYMGEHVEIARGRVCLDPRVLAKMIDALAIQSTDLVLDIGAGLGYSTAVLADIAQVAIGLEQDEALANEASATLAAQGVDNAVIETATMTDGAPAHGPYDCIIVQGAVEEMPDTIGGQLRADGRIVAIFMDGALGTVKIGTKGAAGISWRRIFDATAPILPGFAKEKAFVF